VVASITVFIVMPDIFTDNFSRIENPLASGWDGPIFAGGAQLLADGAKAASSAAGVNADSYVNTVLPADQEARFDENSANADQRLCLRLTNPNTASPNFFECQFKLDTNNIIIRDVIAGATNFNRWNAPPADNISMLTASVLRFRISGGEKPILSASGLFGADWKVLAYYIYTALADVTLRGPGFAGARVFDNTGGRGFDNFACGDFSEVAPLAVLDPRFGPF
jgi:hypothetical protein